MPVTVYTRTSCAPCRTLKTYLQKKGIKFEEKNIDENPDHAAEAFAKTGLAMVPVTVIGDKVIQGLNLPLIIKELMV